MLLFGDPQSIDARLRMVQELRLPDSIPVARLFEVVEPAPAALARSE
jgi:hypothetical protein